MNFFSNIVQMFVGAQQLVDFFHAFWSCLPVSCQLLIAFSFGTMLLLGLLKMVV